MSHKGSQITSERSRGCFGVGLFIVIFSLIISLGCAIKSASKNVSDEEVLKERVGAYWNHRISLDLEKCYEYEHPLTRKMQNLVSYIQSFNVGAVQWKSFDVKKISMEGDTAHVDLALKALVKVPGIKGMESDTVLTDLWVRHEGRWYHVLNRFRERVLHGDQ